MDAAAPDRQTQETYRARVRGSVLGGAIGDALGGPVEFWNLDRILAECGPGGVTEYVPENVGGVDVRGRITDDTQMTLFTMEGMIRALVRVDRGLGFTVGVIHHAYDRWLDTQTLPGPDGSRNGWLITQQWLYSPRAPGNTCLTALRDARGGERILPRSGAPAQNTSKGCGGVMRSAPFGLLPPWFPVPATWPFGMAADAAGFTHGHPTGMLASGALALLIGSIVRGESLRQAVHTALAHLREQPDHEETTRAIEQAMAAVDHPVGPRTMESLGGGWVAEEALAMALYAALAHPEPDEFRAALTLAVTHSGDSDSTGAICGNILGALHGETALPPELVFPLEGRGTILELTDDFILEWCSSMRLHSDYGPDTGWTDRYPGG